MKITKIFYKNLSLVLSGIGIIFGIVLSDQYNQNLPRSLSPATSYLSLQNMQQKLKNENTELKKSISDQDEQITTLQESAKKNQSSNKDLIEKVDELKSSSGIGEVTGQGLTIFLDDAVSLKDTPNSITHASDLRDLVNYLWNNGAIAISITGSGSPEERVGSTTSIDCIVNTILINGTQMVPPFRIKAIGDQTRLAAAIRNESGLKDIYARVKSDKLQFYILDISSRTTIGKFTSGLLTEFINEQK
jgi:uncharacterized protein YlxW (UPF0749 family)